MSDDILLKDLPHGLFYLLEEDLWDPTTQGVDRVQEFGLDGIEQRLEHVVIKGELQQHHTVLLFISKAVFFKLIPHTNMLLTDSISMTGLLLGTNYVLARLEVSYLSRVE